MRDDVPAGATLPYVREWMAGEDAPLPALAEHVSYVCVLTATSMSPGTAELEEYWLTGAWLSWWGGPAAETGLDWPRRADGTPLAHVLTVHLADADGVLGEGRDRRLRGPVDDGLPRTGLLEVFHDLTTTGLHPRDDTGGAWCVRWVADREPRGLQPPPPGTPQPDGCIGLLTMAGWSVPAPTDPPHVDSAVLIGELDEIWSPPEHGPPRPRSYLYGHSRHGLAPVTDLLQHARPGTGNPAHRLVASLSLPAPLTGWWAKNTTLEVWIATDDLEGHRLDRAWCLLR